jgi:hypothetical protein
MAHVLRHGINLHREHVLEQMQGILNGTGKWQVQERERCERIVHDHVALRDAANTAEHERISVEQKAERDAHLAALVGRICLPQVLSRRLGASSTTLTGLAAMLRALIVENDPDAIRAGVAEIADALDEMAAPAAATATATAA